MFVDCSGGAIGCCSLGLVLAAKGEKEEDKEVTHIEVVLLKIRI